MTTAFKTVIAIVCCLVAVALSAPRAVAAVRHHHHQHHHHRYHQQRRHYTHRHHHHAYHRHHHRPRLGHHHAIHVRAARWTAHRGVHRAHLDIAHAYRHDWARHPVAPPRGRHFVNSHWRTVRPHSPRRHAALCQQVMIHQHWVRRCRGAGR